MNVIPVGFPLLVNPLGTTTAGWPVRFVTQRFGLMLLSSILLWGATYASRSARILAIAIIKSIRTRLDCRYSTAGTKRAVGSCAKLGFYGITNDVYTSL